MTLTAATKITIGRILAVPFFILSLVYYSPDKEYFRYIALAIFVLCILSDMIDGYIARVYHQTTKLGAILDPLADKILLISAFICLANIRPHMNVVRFPEWFVIGVISRDGILLLGIFVMHLMNKEVRISPTIWGKATTALQMFSFILTVFSGLDYVRTGLKLFADGGER